MYTSYNCSTWLILYLLFKDLGCEVITVPLIFPLTELFSLIA